MFTIPSISGVSLDSNLLNDANSVGADPSDVDFKFMQLQLKKASLEAQVAYSRAQLLLVEMQLLRLQTELEIGAEAAPHSPACNCHPIKKPRFTKILSKAFKPSTPSTPSTGGGDAACCSARDQDPGAERVAVKRNNTDLREHKNKKIKHSEKTQNKENRECDSTNTPNANVDSSGTHSVDKTKSRTDKKKKKETIQTEGNKNKAAKEKKGEQGKKTQKTGKESKKESKSKTSSKTHKLMKNFTSSNDATGKKTEALDAVDKDKRIKSILKKTYIPEEINNNVPEIEVSPVNNTQDQVTVECNTRAIIHSPGLSTANSTNDGINNESTSNLKENSSKAANISINDAIVDKPENIVTKQEICDMPELRQGMVKLVDAVVDSLPTDLFFKEWNGPIKKEKSMGSAETLVLSKESSYEDLTA